MSNAQREDVIAFLDCAGVVGKDLAHEDAGITVIDADGDLHFFERKGGSVGLLLVVRNEDARVAEERHRSAIKITKIRTGKNGCFIGAAFALVCGPDRYP